MLEAQEAHRGALCHPGKSIPDRKKKQKNERMEWWAELAINWD